MPTLKGLSFERAAVKGPGRDRWVEGTYSIPRGPRPGPGGNHGCRALFLGCSLSWDGEKHEGLGGGLSLPFLSRGAGHLELARETSLKVTVVKIELVWAGMENSCYCLGLGARKEDGQARTWTGNLGLGPSEHTAHLPDSRKQSQEGREEYGTLERSNSSRAQGVCVCGI